MIVVGLGQYLSEPYKSITKGIKQGFRKLGHDFFNVELVKNTISQTKQKIFMLKPDLVFSQCLIDGHNHDVERVLEVMRELKGRLNFKFVYQEGDYKDVSERPKVDLNFVDLIVFNQDYQLDEHAKLWKVEREKCIVFPYASFTHHSLPYFQRNFSNEFVFFGSMNLVQYPGRVKCVEKLKEAGLPLKVFCEPKAYGKNSQKMNVPVYASSKICLSYDYVDHIKHFSSDRPFIITGTGAFCLAHRSKGLDEILIQGKHLVYFNTIEEAIKLYKFFMSRKDMRDKIRREAFKYVQAHHTWKNRCEDLIKILKGQKNHITFKYSEIQKNL